MTEKSSIIADLITDVKHNRSMLDILNEKINTMNELLKQVLSIIKHEAYLVDSQTAQIKPPEQKSELDRMFEERGLVVEEKVTVNGKPKGKRLEVDGYIKVKTEKALQISIMGSVEWYPKSTVHSQYDEMDTGIQSFMIDKWVLKKNGVIE